MARLRPVLVIAALILLAACNGDDSDGGATRDPPSPTATELPAGAQDGPSPTVTSAPRPAGPQPLYLALGDSLSAGIGATDFATRGWVGLVGAALPGWDHLNLGIPGDTSHQLLYDGPLDDGLRTISERELDGVSGNEVGAITLEIGGNDLLDIYFNLVIPGTCPSVVESLEREICVNTLEEALAEFRLNLAETLRRLTEAAPGTPIFLMTLYNPFSGGAQVLDELGVLSLEGLEDTPFPDGLNDVIREVGSGAGVTVVEWYEPFVGKQPEYIASDLIHPNDAGHAVMADVVIEAMAQAGLPVVD